MAEAITVIRDGSPTGQKDRLNRDVLGPDVETHSGGWLFAPAGSVETIGLSRTRVLTRDTLYRRGSAVDITSADRVRVRGLVRVVDGDPEVWPLGMVVRLKIVEG